MSEFTSQGGESFPNLHYDQVRTAGYGDENPDGSYIWTTDRLDAVVLEYANFLRRPDVMPRAERTSNVIIERALFELAWRNGIYSNEQYREDELCEEGVS